MQEQRTLREELRRYYATWREMSLVYEGWAKEQGLSVNMVWVLYALCEEGTVHTQKEIAQQWLLPKQTVNTILKDLAQQGWVTAQPLPEDRRNKRIDLTPEGRRFAEGIVGSLQERELHVLEQLGPAGIAALNDGMARFAALFRAGGET